MLLSHHFLIFPSDLNKQKAEYCVADHHHHHIIFVVNLQLNVPDNISPILSICTISLLLSICTYHFYCLSAQYHFYCLSAQYHFYCLSAQYHFYCLSAHITYIVYLHNITSRSLIIDSSFLKLMSSSFSLRDLFIIPIHISLGLLIDKIS